MAVNKRGSVWYYDFMIRRRRYRGAIPEARTKAQAERVETIKREEVYAGKYSDEPEAITFREFTERLYLPIARETTRNFSCNAGYESKKLIEQFGPRPINQITHFEIEKWLLTLKADYAGATINHFIKRARVIFNRAVIAGYVDAAKNPMRLVKKVEEKPKVKRRLSREEEARLIEIARDLGFDYVASAIICRVETGLRPMEFAGMGRDQVKPSDGFIIAHSFKGKAGQVKERTIPLTNRARLEFEKLLAATAEDRIFPYDSIKKAWETVCTTAGIEEFWYRWLRDEAASRWAEAGLDAFTIAQLLGHSSPRTSMIYVRAWAGETARKMEAAAAENIATNLPQEANGKVIRLPVNG
ncbi:MAG: tyrosine-type recombinase/integrase [Blastocatellia bacterium]